MRFENQILAIHVGYSIHPQARRAASGIDMSQCIDVANKEVASDAASNGVLYTRSNLMLVVFEQFSSVTSTTSSGSANVISTH